MQEGNSNVKWTYTKSQPEVGKWVRVVHTFVAKDSTISVYAGADSSSVATAGFVTGFQLERGNKVTDWSLATKDINDLIDAANKRYDDMKVGGTQMLTGTDFKDASGWSRWGSIRICWSLRTTAIADRESTIYGNEKRNYSVTSTFRY